MILPRLITHKSLFCCSRTRITQSGLTFISSQVRIARMSSLPRLPIFEAISSHDPKSTAVIHSKSGRRFTYGELLGDVAEAKDHLDRVANGSSLKGERIAFLIENSYDYVGTHCSCQSPLDGFLIREYSNVVINIGQSLDRSTFGTWLSRERITIHLE